MASHAADPARSRGRLHPQPPSATRDAFSRDRDRIVHCVAFRRLNGKTQVFAAASGDHYRVRLTHSLEVAQIARTLARAMGLNADLAEAIALAHDLGHPPFGHAGEEALKAALAHSGGWDHNGHTLRVVTRLETPYPAFVGLNLTWETLEGLAKHNGPVTRPGWALAEADREWSLELAEWPTLEAQVAALADDIAYDCHDLDDGIRAGLIDLDQIRSQSFLAECWAAARARFPASADARLAPEMVREALGRITADLLATSRARIDAGERSPGIALSPTMAPTERALKAFLYANLYHHPEVARLTTPATELVAALYAALSDDPYAMPPEWRAALPGEKPAHARHIADYVGGMTDRFAIREHERLVGESSLPRNGF